MRVPSTDGVELALHDLGGHGEPFLVAHATGFCGRAYEPLANGLAGPFHVYSLDFRFHGDSGRPADDDFSWRGMGDDVLAVVDSLGGGPLHAFGHSMGGAALLLAERTRPGLLRSVYLFEPIVFPVEMWRPEDPNPLAMAARRRREVFDSKGEVMLRYAARPPLNVLRADALAAYVEHGFAEQEDGTVRLKCRSADEAGTFGSDSKVTTADVAGLDVPAVVAVGRPANKPVDPATFGPAVVASLARARLVRYDRLGHLGPLQDPDTVAADVLAAVSAS
jgi:pimeloyl-ACP methyl ester carboxylesterase